MNMENEHVNHGVVGADPLGSAWYVRYMRRWKPATDEQVKAALNYLETHQENQMIGEPVIFRDVKYINGTIYTVYTCGVALVEMLYDTPKHIAYLNRT